MQVNKTIGAKWRTALNCILALVIPAVALVELWQNFCHIPTEMEFSHAFRWSLVVGDHSETTGLRMMHSEMSKELDFLGTIDSLGYEFTYQCQPDLCAFEFLELSMRLQFYPLCELKQGVSSHVVSIHTGGFHRPYINPRPKYYISMYREWDEPLNDYPLVNRYALELLDDAAWHEHEALLLSIKRFRGQWLFYIGSSIGNPPLGALKDSDLSQMKEEYQ